MAAERAAEMAGNAQSGAAQSAQAAANSAQAAERAKQEAQNAAAALPAPSQEFAGMVPMVNPEGNGYIFGEAGGGKIDDTTLGRDTTWSSLKIVDSLAPEFEESGPVVTCNPIPGYPLSVVSQINAVQSGTGDPSPENVRPIVGWERSNLWVGGKNLLSLTDYTNITNGPIVNENEIIFSKNLGVVDYVFQNMKPGQYTVSLKRSGYSGIEVTVGGKRAIINGGSSIYKGTFAVAMAEVVTISFSEGQNANREQRIISDVMLTFGDHFEYERYKQGSDVKSMSFGQTVYGGTLNWATGELTVTHVKHVEDGSKPILAYGDYYVLPSVSDDLVGVFSKLPLSNLCTCTWSNAAANMAGIDNAPQVFGVSTPEGLQGLLAKLYSEGNPLYFVYELKNSIKVQLTPAEILALAGTNTLYTNTGDTTVVGRADPNAVIKELEDRIAALQGGGWGTVYAQQVLLSRTLAAPCTTFSDAQALSMPDILPTWEELLKRGEKIKQGVYLMKDGQCYRVMQEVIPIESQPPGADGMLAVYRPIDRDHAGTIDDPIPWVNGMDCFKDKYYSNEGKVYLCKQDMTPCVWAPGTAGVWQWEVVS